MNMNKTSRKSLLITILLGGLLAASPAPASGPQLAAAQRVQACKAKKKEGALPGTRPSRGTATKPQAQEPVPLGPVVVTAPTRKQEPYYVQQVICPQEVSRPRVEKTAAGLLESLSGVDLTRKGISGADSNRLRLRGLDESRSLIELNGRPLNGAGVYGGYYVDWSSLSLEDVDHVEVIRGAGPVKYGNTLGGVVNIVTKEGSGSRHTTVQASGGPLGTWDAGFSHGWGVGPLLYTISAGRHETDGYLRNNFARRTTTAGRVSWLLPQDLRLDFAGRYTFGKTGMIVYNMPDSPYYDRHYPRSIDSPLGGPFLNFKNHRPGRWGPYDWGNGSHWTDDRGQFDTALTRPGDRFGFTLRAFLTEQYRDEFFTAITDGNHLLAARHTRPEKDNWGWRVDLNSGFRLAGSHRLEYGGEGDYLGYGGIHYRRVDRQYLWWVPGDTPDRGKISKRHGGYIQDLWQPIERLSFEFGVRVDGYHASAPDPGAVAIDETRWNPFAGIILRPWSGNRVSFRYRRANRFPTLPEYYWWYSGYRPIARKPLRSEQADEYDFQIQQRLVNRFDMIVRTYRYDIDGYIRTIFGYRPSRVVYNIDTVKLTGLEAGLQYRGWRSLELGGNYTWETSKKTGDVLDYSSLLTDRLVELPRNKANVEAGYANRNGLIARASFRYVDVRYAVRGNVTRPGYSFLGEMDPIFDLSLYVSFPLWRSSAARELRVNSAMENLLNRHYQEEYGYPMPGFVAMSGLSFRF